jgi:hypothetical protein
VRPSRPRGGFVGRTCSGARRAPSSRSARALANGSQRGTAPIVRHRMHRNRSTLVCSALADPAVNWVALELRHHRCAAILRRALLTGAAKNVCVLGGDARTVVGAHIARHSVDRVWVNYPEPPSMHDHQVRARADGTLLCVRGMSYVCSTLNGRIASSCPSGGGRPPSRCAVLRACCIGAQGRRG